MLLRCALYAKATNFEPLDSVIAYVCTHIASYRPEPFSLFTPPPADFLGEGVYSDYPLLRTLGSPPTAPVR